MPSIKTATSPTSVMAGSRYDELEFVRMDISGGNPRSRAAAEGELADWAFDVEVDPCHPREQIDEVESQWQKSPAFL